jgi:hypothetical protein
MDATFETQIAAFVAHAQLVMDKATNNTTVFVEAPGKRYVRIVRACPHRSVYAFVDKTNGDILMPASWKAPAKHARGNVTDPATWTCAGPWGIAYLR